MVNSQNNSRLKCHYLYDQKEIEKTLRLRYAVFINEKTHNSVLDISSDNLLSDDIDSKAHHFGVYDNDELIAGARYAINKKSDIAAFRFFPEYGYDYLSSKVCKKSSICIGEPDWVVVKKDYRFSPASLMLFYHILEHMVENYPVDILVAMVEEGNLVDFYRKFGFSIVTESKRKIDAYANNTLTTDYFAYLSIDERVLQNVSNILSQGLLSYDKEYYEEKIKKFFKKLVQLISFE